ncbi:hypothetical protein SASPL_133675 [Salvia splendens]|uniref:2-isopropylmalate synthase LeuA allosteric (dimerisation) domain-containing protein n=1 Tax=Salvia splendens TaxID=180675 RepID=A0A8X8ZIQ0_SALSN|nr:hypothetical protein SASPL_133675 [Salvia splendens]
MNAVAEGIGATATTRVLIRRDDAAASNGVSFSGTGAEMDIVVSSVCAYIGALNKMLRFQAPTKSEITNQL